jgi:hypothetical protein
MIFTQHNDNQRTGANLGETRLTTATVRERTFGKLFERLVDGSVYAQPLVVPNVLIRPSPQAPGRRHNVLYVATMHNSVYAFDADNPTSIASLWHRHLANSIQLPDDDVAGQDYKDMEWEVGIVGTPVIDTDRAAIYCVTTSRQEKRSIPIHQLWKLALDTGATVGSRRDCRGLWQ